MEVLLREKGVIEVGTRDAASVVIIQQIVQVEIPGIVQKAVLHGGLGND